MVSQSICHSACSWYRTPSETYQQTEFIVSFLLSISLLALSLTWQRVFPCLKSPPLSVVFTYIYTICLCSVYSTKEHFRYAQYTLYRRPLVVQTFCSTLSLNPLNAELNPICHLLALLGVHHFLHLSRIRVKSLTLRLLMSYIYIYMTLVA